MNIEQARVVKQTTVGSSYHLLELRAPMAAEKVRPGQFVHVKVPRLDGAVLRRPFSVFRSDGVNLSILYKPVGRGTDAMMALREGDELSLLGPLGNGFPPCAPGMVPVIVAGGYGVAPLLFFASRLGRSGVAFLGGARSADILFNDDLRLLGWEVRVATEDGSTGTKGYVTQAFDNWLAEKGGRMNAECYACGPDGMLKAIAERAMSRGWKAWLSLDKHMGCGMGACLACVQRIRYPDNTEGWARVCREGPVFEARKIVW